MRTVRSFATEEEEAAHYSKKLGHTLRKYFKMSAIYGSWMWSNNVRGGEGRGGGWETREGGNCVTVGGREYLERRRKLNLKTREEELCE